MSRLRIVVADDDAQLQDLLTVWLLELGHEVTAVGDGRALVDHCAHGTTDLVVSDVRMPGLDGLTAAAAIRERHPTPIILLSGSWTAEQRHRAGQLAAVVLEKPVRPLTLVTAIDAAGRRDGCPLPAAAR